MREPYTQLYVHFVWATWDRLPLITPEVEGPLYRALAAKMHELKCDAVAIGGMLEHVHVLARLSATLAVATFAKEVKGNTSHFMTHVITPDRFFEWQGAYGAFTVGKREVDSVASYILRQKLHHAENSLIEDWERSETADPV